MKENSKLINLSGRCNICLGKGLIKNTGTDNFGHLLISQSVIVIVHRMVKLNYHPMQIFLPFH